MLFSPDGRFVPDDLPADLKTWVPRPPQDSIRYEPASAVNNVGGIRIFQGELNARIELKAVLRLIEGGKVSVSAKTRRPTAATQRALGQLLPGGDFYPPEWTPDEYTDPIGAIRAFAWPILMQAGGFAQLSGNKLALTKRGRQALTAPVADSVKTLFRRWLTHDLMDEFGRIDQIKGQTSGGGRHMTAAGSRRPVIERPLSDLQVGKWVAIDEWGRHIRASDGDFEISTDTWRLYITDSQYGSLGYDGNWDILNKRYLLALLFEYIATMGMIDIAYVYPNQVSADYVDLWGADHLPFLSRYDGLLCFRLNALGAHVLNQTKTYAPSIALPASRLTYIGDGVIRRMSQ